jgi:hypothetical protein
MEQGSGNEWDGRRNPDGNTKRSGELEKGREKIAWKRSAAPLFMALLIIGIALDAVVQFEFPPGRALFVAAAGVGVVSLWIV